MPRKPERPCRYPGLPEPLRGRRTVLRRAQGFDGAALREVHARLLPRQTVRPAVAAHPHALRPQASPLRGVPEARTVCRGRGGPPHRSPLGGRDERRVEPHEPVPFLPREDPQGARRPMIPRPGGAVEISVAPSGGKRRGVFCAKKAKTNGNSPARALKERIFYGERRNCQRRSAFRAGTPEQSDQGKNRHGNPGGRKLQIMDLPSLRTWRAAKRRTRVTTCSKNSKAASTLCAADVFKETWEWLASLGCEKLVSRQLIDQYAMSVARWIQCEHAISRYSMLSKHPTSGKPIPSPFVTMSQNYMKQTNQLWYQIYQVVKENC
jgi:hypothetical protein